MTKSTKIDRINEQLAGCAREREHLEARWTELCRLHSCSTNDEDGYDLWHVAFIGQPYVETIERITRRRAKRAAQGNT